MKRNNRGFTLIELIVSTAILGIIAAGIFGFMTTGASSYRLVYGNVQLQTIAQQAVNQIQETVMDCNTAVYTDGENLYLLSCNKSGIYTVSAYTLNGTTSTLNYQQKSEVVGVMAETSITESDCHVLTKYVTDFSVSVEQKTGTADLASVTVTLHFDRQGKTCETSQTIALRNAPGFRNSLSDLIACTADS